jgi:SAM-dependent methyltransferase
MAARTNEVRVALVDGPNDYFDEDVAATYDEDSSDRFDPSVLNPTVDFLADLAGSGRALEFGIGTGRVALPLLERGVEVRGIDLSPSMVARLREKPRGTEIPVTIGDFSTTKIEASFTLVYVVFNTIGNLTTQAAQVACFRNAAAHLAPGGSFVVELLVPNLQRLPPGERFQVFGANEGNWGIDEIDVVTQRAISHHISFVDGKASRTSLPFRYAWPAELDLMAQLAGMALGDRFGGWNREPFTSESRSHVSVWETPPSLAPR